MRAEPIFRDVTSDTQLKGLQAVVEIDRDRANDAGVNIQDIRTALYSAYGDRQISTIFTSSNSYQVILQDADSGLVLMLLRGNEKRLYETNQAKISS